MIVRDKEIALKLSREGIEFSNSLKDENRNYFQSLKNSYFSIAAAISLTWTKHALYENEFITYAAGYIDGVLPYDSSFENNFCFRFGAESLANALLNYRRYYRSVHPLMPNFYTCVCMILHDYSNAY